VRLRGAHFSLPLSSTRTTTLQHSHKQKERLRPRIQPSAQTGQVLESRRTGSIFCVFTSAPYVTCRPTHISSLALPHCPCPFLPFTPHYHILVSICHARRAIGLPRPSVSVNRCSFISYASSEPIPRPIRTCPLPPWAAILPIRHGPSSLLAMVLPC